MYRESSNGKDYFIMQVEEGNDLDTIAIRMMEENAIQGIMPFRYLNTIDGTYFEYEIIGQDTLKSWLAVSHSKSEVMSILNSLIQVSDEAEANLLEVDRCYSEHEFITVDNNKCNFAYIPYMQYSNGGFMQMIENVVYKVSVLQNENFDYIYDLRNAFSSDEIVSIADLRKWLNNIQGQEVVNQEGLRQGNNIDPRFGFVQQQNMNQGNLPLPQAPLQWQNMQQNPSNIIPNTNFVQDTSFMSGDVQGGKEKKKAEKAPKKSIFSKKEKNSAVSQPPSMETDGAASPFDDFFDMAPKKKSDSLNNTNISNNMNTGLNGSKMSNSSSLYENVGVTNTSQQATQEDSAQKKSGGKFKIPSFGGKKQAEVPPSGNMSTLQNGGMMPPQNGRMPMPQNPGMMPPQNGRMPMPQNPGMMPQQNGRMPMPQNPGMMPPQNGRMPMSQNPGMMSPQNGRMPMPQNPGMMPPQNGRMPMPQNPGMMPPQNSGMPMPQNPGMMPQQNGRMPMPSNGKNLMSPSGKIMNELEFESEVTVLISNSGSNSRGCIKCKDFPNGFLLDRDSYIIGIGKQADIRITGNSTISRKHARIFRQGESFYIMDEGSLNGTFVNDRQLMINESCKLENGTKIKLSDETIIFEMR